MENDSDCGGATACYIGMFKGIQVLTTVEVYRADMIRFADETVTLADHIDGYYRGKSCGGSCTPPQIFWRQGNFEYQIQFLVDGTADTSKRAIIDMANSAILSAAGRTKLQTQDK